MKLLFIALAFCIAQPVLAQSPHYVPFRYHGQLGIMEKDGSPGIFGDYYTVVGDFSAYILTDALLTNESGSFFYFDFNGTFFPRGVPMIPKSMMEWK